jgi:hypothetical protein
VTGPVLTLHVAAGLGAVVAGYAALAVRKGAGAHRLAGNVFFGAMLVLAVTAGVLGMPFGGALTGYLVVTSWLTVRRPAGTVGNAERAAFAFAAGVAVLAPTLGGLVTDSGGTERGHFLAAGVMALCAALDFRMLRRGGIAGFERVRRHLWRMCAAMFIATGSFFLGQADEIPRALHGPHLWVLGLAPLAALLWWMIRSRPRKRPARVVPAPA